MGSKVKVAVRVRPINKRGELSRRQCLCQEGAVSVSVCLGGMGVCMHSPSTCWCVSRPTVNHGHTLHTVAHIT